MEDIINNISSSFNNIEIKNTPISTYVKQNNIYPSEPLTNKHIDNQHNFHTHQNKEKQVGCSKNEFVRELKYILNIPKKLNTDNKIIIWMKQQVSLNNEQEETKQMGYEDKLEYMFDSINILNNIELYKLDCFIKFDNCHTIIKHINKKYNCNLSITLLRFHKYVIFGDNAFKKSIENEIKKKIKNKRKNDIQQSIIDVKTHIIKKNDREDRMKKRKMQ